MVNHGLSTGALFLLVGMVYERTHTRDLGEMGGLASVMPWLAGVFLFVVFASRGLPGLNRFVGEFLVLLGTFSANKTFGADRRRSRWCWPRSTSVVLPADGARRPCRGAPGLPDVSVREVAVLAPVLAAPGVRRVPEGCLTDRIDPRRRRVVAHVGPDHPADVGDRDGRPGCAELRPSTAAPVIGTVGPGCRRARRRSSTGSPILPELILVGAGLIADAARGVRAPVGAGHPPGAVAGRAWPAPRSPRTACGTGRALRRSSAAWSPPTGSRWCSAPAPARSPRSACSSPRTTSSARPRTSAASSTRCCCSPPRA